MMIATMTDRVPEDGYVARNGERQIQSRKITFGGLRRVEGKTFAMISASQIWTEEYYERLKAESEGGPVPQGEQMKMLIPLEDVLDFVNGIGAALKEWEEHGS